MTATDCRVGDKRGPCIDSERGPDEVEFYARVCGDDQNNVWLSSNLPNVGVRQLAGRPGEV